MSMARTRNLSAWAVALEDVRKIGARVRTAMSEAAQRRARYRQTVRELNALSDRELDDIGIPRSAIRTIARAHTQEG